MQRQIELIGAAWGLGGADPACGDAPAVLAPLVAARLGGDHSCAGGTWSGVARTLQEKSAGSLGLLWIDAHMDSHTPGTSHTGRLHGMPLAWLLGQDDDPLYGLASGVVEARNVCIVGVRSFEPRRPRASRAWACASSSWTRSAAAASRRCSPKRSPS